MGDIKQTHATSLKKGSYVIFDGLACVVRSVQTSRPGKHGHAKCRVEAVSMIGSKKIIKIMPGHDKVDVPIIEKRTAQVLSVSGEKASVMDSETFETFELEIPEELKGEIKDGIEVLYWVILDDKIIKQIKS